MTRRERTEILAYCKAKTLMELSQIVLKNHQIQVLEKPNTGLVMLPVKDSAMKQVFYLGEVFVTECKVLLEDAIGLGIIMGSHPKKAYHMAVIDAAYNSHIPETKELDSYLEKIKKKKTEEKCKYLANLYRTKVNFTTLEEEVKA